MRINLQDIDSDDDMDFCDRKGNKNMSKFRDNDTLGALHDFTRVKGNRAANKLRRMEKESTFHQIWEK